MLHGVEGFLLHCLAARSARGDFRVVHHRLGDLVVGLGPQVDLLVVLLTLGHQTRGVLICGFPSLLGGRIQ